MNAANAQRAATLVLTSCLAGAGIAIFVLARRARRAQADGRAQSRQCMQLAGECEQLEAALVAAAVRGARRPGSSDQALLQSLESELDALRQTNDRRRQEQHEEFLERWEQRAAEEAPAAEKQIKQEEAFKKRRAATAASSAQRHAKMQERRALAAKLEAQLMTASSAAVDDDQSAAPALMSTRRACPSTP